VKISELARLSGVPSATIKHYMREGLLPGPARRTGRNMAYYDVRLAARVKAIKELQQTHFFPLKMIGDMLEPPPSAHVRGDVDADTRRKLGLLGPSIRAGHEQARAVRAAERSSGRRTVAELLADCDISTAELTLLGELGLAHPVQPPDGAAYYSGADLEIIEIIDETRRKGMGELFPMETLEPYVACVRALARVEIAMFRRAAIEGEHLPDVPLADVAREATQLGERLVVAMRQKLVVAALHEIAKDGSA
jgi:DNA-binding transcriptional MerR regulator